MKVAIENTLYNNNNNIDNLDGLVKLFEIGRHQWIIQDNNDFDIIAESKWAGSDAREKTQNTILKFIEEAFEKSFYSGNNPDIEVVPIKASYLPREYPLKDALIYLTATVQVIIENTEYDSQFLDALIKHFPSAKAIKHAKNKRWLEYTHAAGTGSIIQLINRQLKRFEQEDLNPYKYLRLFVLIDSDKLYSTMGYPNIQNKIMQECIKYNISYHFLYKREMENYLPIKALETLNKVKVGSVVNAFSKLNPEQQDFYDFEKGFKKIKTTKLLTLKGLQVHTIKLLRYLCLWKKMILSEKYLPEQINLYKNLSDNLYENLKNGFKGIRPKRTLPPLFLSNIISKELLMERCDKQPDPNELKNILIKIDKLL